MQRGKFEVKNTVLLVSLKLYSVTMGVNHEIMGLALTDILAGFRNPGSCLPRQHFREAVKIRRCFTILPSKSSQNESVVQRCFLSTWTSRHIFDHSH